MAKTIKKTARKGNASKASKASTKTASKKGKKTAKAKVPAKPTFRMDDWAREENARTTGNAFAAVEKKYQLALETEGKSVSLKLEVGAVINKGLDKMDAAKRAMTGGKGLNAKEREWFYIALQDRGIVTGLYEKAGNKMARTGKCKNINHWSLTADFWLASPELAANIKAGVAFDCYRRIANAANAKKGEKASEAKKREAGVLKAVKAIAECNEDNAPSIDEVRALLGEDVKKVAPSSGPVLIGSPMIQTTIDRCYTWSVPAQAYMIAELLNGKVPVEVIGRDSKGREAVFEIVAATAVEGKVRVECELVENVEAAE